MTFKTLETFGIIRLMHHRFSVITDRKGEGVLPTSAYWLGSLFKGGSLSGGGGLCLEGHYQLVCILILVLKLMQQKWEKCTKSKSFFKIFSGHISFYGATDCFGLLVTSPLGFKARVDMLICTW